MDDGRWNRVFESLGRITAHIDDIKEDLKYHIKRTDMLEQKLEPVEDHVKFVKKAGAIVLTVGGVLVGYFLA